MRQFELRLGVMALALLSTGCLAEPQGFGGFLQNLFRPVANIFSPIRSVFGGGVDKIFPDDCGRDDKNKGKLCFGEPNFCRERTSLGGIENFNGHNYLFSWRANSDSVRNAKWDWFNARNYCRKRCMDLVSFETRAEYEWVKERLGGVQFIWTSGRKCNFDGCNKPELQPTIVNGWFWSANQVKIAPTNSNNPNSDWSPTGGAGQPQPDNREQIQQGGEEEACLAVLNNFYGDGIKWHDVSCNHEKPIVCEDEPGHLNFVLGKK